jgi:hypothetical protein
MSRVGSRTGVRGVMEAFVRAFACKRAFAAHAS